MSTTLPLFRGTGFGKRRNTIRCVDAVCNLARRLWPSKTAANLAGRSGISKRAAELWLEGRTEPGADALVSLLRSDAGFDLMQAIMEGSGTRWWSEFERGVRIAELEQRLNWHRDQLEKLKGDMK
jgi:hypothetical protein